jgi:carboxymethylenebutenolidase
MESALKTEWLDITASDGKTIKMYIAIPDNKPKGAIVVLQEIFGVNEHIRSVCERYAAEGYVAAAPAIFDRLSPGYERGYAPEDVQAGIAMMKDFDRDAVMLDIGAAVDAVKQYGKVGVVGYCLGGSLAYRAAISRDDLAAASCYYGGMVSDMADMAPKCPTIVHFGETDQSIPLEKAEIVKQKRPEVPVYIYPAGHGFSCDARSAYEPVSAKLAWERTLELFAENVG